jgi:uncharacterized protein YbcV (DUF1398 family)
VVAKFIFPDNVYLQSISTKQLKQKNMFSLEQIKQAYDKVQTETDFAIYIKELIQLGIKGYDTFIADGRVVYYGDTDHKASTDKKYDHLSIAPTASKERFIECLVMHESNQTDYYTFCQQAAQCGIAKSRIDIIEMVCTYLSAEGDAIVIEKLPV